VNEEELASYYSSKISKLSPFSLNEIPDGTYRVVTTLEFSALLPGTWKLDSMQVINLYSAVAREDYFSATTILSSLIPEEKKLEFNALSEADAIDVLNDWLGK
jgi:hypothetical protein